MDNHFTLLGLTPDFAIDLAQLEENYRQLQAKVHPDKFVTASPAERLQSMQTATQANEAYQTLKNPTSRAKYLLQLQGVDTNDEQNTVMPPDFLMAQMEWREAIDDAKAANDIDALDNLLDTFAQETKALHTSFASNYLNSPDAAATDVRKLYFVDKISEDVRDLLAKLDD